MYREENIDSPHRFLSIPRRTSYPPHPEPRMTNLSFLAQALAEKYLPFAGFTVAEPVDRRKHLRLDIAKLFIVLNLYGIKSIL